MARFSQTHETQVTPPHWIGAFTRPASGGRGASGGGWLADQTGWVVFFLITAAAALPGLLLLVWMMRRYPPAPRAVGEGAPAD